MVRGVLYWTVRRVRQPATAEAGFTAIYLDDDYRRDTAPRVCAEWTWEEILALP